MAVFSMPNFIAMASALLKADPADVSRQPIRVLRHHLNGVRAVCFEDAHRTRRTDAVAVQKNHDLAYSLLLGPGCHDPARPHGSDPIDLL
jgi:hypothetical protein